MTPISPETIEIDSTKLSNMIGIKITPKSHHQPIGEKLSLQSIDQKERIPLQERAH